MQDYNYDIIKELRRENHYLKNKLFRIDCATRNTNASLIDRLVEIRKIEKEELPTESIIEPIKYRNTNSLLTPTEWANDLKKLIDKHYG